MENYGKLWKAPPKSAFKRILSPFLFSLAFHGKHNYGKVIRSNFAEGAKSFFFHNSVGDHNHLFQHQHASSIYCNFKVLRIKCGRSLATKNSKCSLDAFGSHVWRRLLDPLEPGSLGVFDLTVSDRSPVESEALSKLLLRLEEEVSNGGDRSW